MFEKLNWYPDKMVVNGLTFRLQHTKNDHWNEGDNHFIFYKIKKLIDQYESYFKNYPENATPKNIVEIGMWDGGSLAFWNEVFDPEKIIGIDIKESGVNEYFQNYLQKVNSKSQKVKPYWGTDQADNQQLIKIVEENFENKIDIIFDDGSHMYAQTLATFNTLFPQLKTGGIYIIEDWAWSHWKGFENILPPNTEPTRFVAELVQVAGNYGLIENITIYQGFIVVERGSEPISGDFNILNHIYNRPINFKTKLKSALKIFNIYPSKKPQFL
jgi:cephalosporin hydroxylase